jgi:hypothetical protein
MQLRQRQTIINEDKSPHPAFPQLEVFDPAGKPLPTSLRHGATLTHIRRYLGHVSDRMAEH